MRALSGLRWPAPTNGGLVGKFRSLRSEMAGYALVDPALDLSGEVKDFDRHGGRPLKVRGWRRIAKIHGTPKDPATNRIYMSC
jgi:hypothetical protein